MPRWRPPIPRPRACGLATEPGTRAGGSGTRAEHSPRGWRGECPIAWIRPRSSRALPASPTAAGIRRCGDGLAGRTRLGAPGIRRLGEITRPGEGRPRSARWRRGGRPPGDRREDVPCVARPHKFPMGVDPPSSAGINPLTPAEAGRLLMEQRHRDLREVLARNCRTLPERTVAGPRSGGPGRRSGQGPAPMASPQRVRLDDRGGLICGGPETGPDRPRAPSLPREGVRVSRGLVVDSLAADPEMCNCVIAHTPGERTPT